MNAIVRYQCIHGMIMLLLCFWLAVTAVLPAQAQESIVLDSLSLEELLNMSITSTSKSSEKLSDAPGIVSVVTAQDIANYGALSLLDVLDRLASIYVLGTYFLADNMVSIRGDNSEQFNTRVLVLLDGRPFRESVYGGDNRALYTMFPVERIQQIEVIRGPGSVLYGTGAYTGVINIITRKASKQPLSAAVRYGSFDRLQASASGGVRIGELSIAGGVNYVNDGGWNFRAADETPLANGSPDIREFRRSLRGVGAQFSLHYGEAKINAYYGFAQHQNMGSVPIYGNPPWFANSSSRLFVDGEYSLQILPSWRTVFNVTGNFNFYRAFNPVDSATDDIQRAYSNDVLIESTNFIEVSPNIKLVAGALINAISGRVLLPNRTDSRDILPVINYPIFNAPANPNPFQGIAPYSELWWSVYGQFEYKPIEQIKLVAGAQLNKVPNLNLDIVPRLGAIATISEELSAKVLFGQAFRSGSAGERFLKFFPVVFGQPNILPERIQTIEAQVNFFSKNNRLQLAATYFNNTQRDLIVRSLPSDSLVIINGQKFPVPLQINRGQLSTQGVELEGQGKITNELNATFAVTYQTSVDDRGNRDVTGMPMLMAKLGVSYEMPFGLTLGVFHSYFGAGGDIRASRAFNSPVDAFHWMTAQAALNIKRLAGNPSMPDVVLEIMFTNVLDARVMFPEYVRRTLNSIPGRPGRAIYATLRVSF